MHYILVGPNKRGGGKEIFLNCLENIFIHNYDQRIVSVNHVHNRYWNDTTSQKINGSTLLRPPLQFTFISETAEPGEGEKCPPPPHLFR